MLRGVSERIIFGESVKIGTHSFEVMIDRENVNQYNIKPKKDREHEAEEKDELNIYSMDNPAARTPMGMDTPIVKIGGASIYAPTGKSSYYGGKSPGFRTPIYNYSQREFSERELD
jgi:hypothetical protein